MSTRKIWKKSLFAVAAVVSLLVGSLAIGQQPNVEEGKRKVKTKSNPVFPELARRMNITGKVRIEASIAPDGRVKTVKALGGHPVLAQACLDAVRDWRFEPAPEETTQIIEFTFQQ